MRHLTQTRTPLIAALVGGLLLVGCGGESAPGAGTDEDDSASVQPTESAEPTDPVPPEEPTGGAPEAMVDQAIADLTKRASVDASDVAVVQSVAVTWRDGSIGCAEKGKGYTQVLVEGYLIELEAAGTTYAYHQGSLADPAAAPFYCAAPTEDPLSTES